MLASVAATVAAAADSVPVADGGGTLGGWLGGTEAVVSVAARHQSVHSSPRGDRLGGLGGAIRSLIQQEGHGQRTWVYPNGPGCTSTDLPQRIS